MNTISDKIYFVVEQKKALLAKHKKELDRLLFLQKSSKKLPVTWNGHVTAKNAYRVYEVGRVLEAFKRQVENTQKFSRLEDVRISTNRLWRMTQRNYSENANSRFRGQLDWMKKEGLIVYNNESSKWRLTTKAIGFICE